MPKGIPIGPAFKPRLYFTEGVKGNLKTFRLLLPSERQLEDVPNKTKEFHLRVPLHTKKKLSTFRAVALAQLAGFRN
jgi:hypothetical protein